MSAAHHQTGRGRPGTVDVVVLGAGHSGLAMSHCLAERGIEHVVLERGEVGNAWRHERWASLRLLTPNWQSRLPGYRYHGADPDGFMTMPEVVDFIAGYARQLAAPVHTGTTVTSVTAMEGGYRVRTDRGEWRCRALVIATGARNLPAVPALTAAVPPEIFTIHPLAYRQPEQLPPGGVLVVGASATGVQLADELQRSGRPVTLAVGEHVRVPRRYRGRDIQWWLDAAGILDQRYDEVDDPVRVRHLPSPQLVGSPEHATLDLNALGARGVHLVGRLAGLRDGRLQFSGSLRNVCALADLKLGRLLDTLDAWASANGLDEAAHPPERLPPTRLPERPVLELDLRRGAIRSIVWATGFRPDYRWLHLPVLDRKGRLRHDGGVVAPGLYALGLPFLRRRKSSFIHGAEDDARELTAHLVEHLRRSTTGRLVPVAGWTPPDHPPGWSIAPDPAAG
ncbi:flavin-containing monooxygenase [Spiribacter halobius]|uniref:Pyridine nucleotide-disulfide oxidoreductase n=1 Tax=Sediminicurvatus halobius TaxID=2182432 RepID=A0A2U2N5M3_9GAMM|nr:NAD(P)/FAD-dependent oxidoreductase [Spiribacter halobius]PWG64367.1 pyridine nucleotide-disulfide oxidoreductase [Spiribacter halobius]UEX79285.1 NAD(P)/FAD-dependent oxidoreductase [Spiribacter halobius]